VHRTITTVELEEGRQCLDDKDIETNNNNEQCAPMLVPCFIKGVVMTKETLMAITKHN
jgi:hypothetical protein